MTSRPAFVETREYRRFVEFCNECRQARYIGLCYGPPGVGKTLSAHRYADWDLAEVTRQLDDPAAPAYGGDILVYTPPVVNTPKQVEVDISRLRSVLRNRYALSYQYEAAPQLAASRELYESEQARYRSGVDGFDGAAGRRTTTSAGTPPTPSSSATSPTRPP